MPYNGDSRGPGRPAAAGAAAAFCGSVLVILLLAALAAPAHAATPELDQTTLPALLDARKVPLPKHFKALVLVVGTDGAVTRAYDTGGASDDREDWWPASCVKLFAAVAALEKTHALGFTPGARVTWGYEKKPVTLSLAAVVRRALIPSDNVAFDRLVEIVGFDDLNGRFFVPRNGLGSTVLLRAYGGRVKNPVTGHGSNRHSPPITLREGKHEETLPARTGEGTFECPDQGNCTTLRELAEAMRRVVMHEKLPETERFALGEVELTLLRRSLSAKRPRGNGVVDGLAQGLGDERVTLYHKPGFARRWFSDVVFVDWKGKGRRYIVAMAGYPGRDALDAPALAVGKLLRAGKLK